jgi:hypothetical protein
MPHIAELNLLSIGVVLVTSGFLLALRPSNPKLGGIFLTALLLFIVLPVDDLALGLVDRAVSIRYDLYVDCFDQFFGSPSFFMGRLFLRWYWFQNVALYLYVLVPSVCLSLAVLRFALLSKAEAVRTVRTILFSCLLAYPLYAAFPVAGPRYAFPSFPVDPPGRGAPHIIHLQALPNGVPSVHMTLAILVLRFASPWMWGRVLGTIFVLLTIAATLGSGEHYLFDLLVAVPYSALVLYLGGYSSAAASKRVVAQEMEVGVSAS